MSFSDRLLAVRNARGVRQTDAASAAGVSVRAYQYYEKDAKEPTLSVLTALADYFRVPLDFLCGRGVFANWDDYAPQLDAVADAVASLLGLSAEDLSALPLPDLVSIIAVTCARINYDPETNTFDIYPLISPTDVRKYWQLDR